MYRKQHVMIEDLFTIPHKKESAVDAVVNRFRELIMQRRLKPGDLLPSESALAEGMGVSRGSVREAMKILTALGVVEIRRGDGTYVSGDIGRTLLDPFLLRLMLNGFDRTQIIEFREMIEFDVARAAARRKSAAGFEAMRRAADRMESALASGGGGDTAALAAMDVEFHKATGKATGNVLIEQLYEFVLNFFEPSIRETYNDPGNAAKALGYHRAILRALQEGGEAEALQAVKESIRGWAGEEGRQC